jgi:hypothetical protein
MADSEDEQPQALKPQAQPEAPPPTPFDHPLFLPVILSGLALWFGYDGWFNPEMADHLTFNRYGFGVLLLGAIWYGYKGLQEMKEAREAEGRGGDSSSSPTPGS